MILGENDNAFLKELFSDNSLAHEYDPVKAHAYYERTKKLKGRRKGRQPDPSGTSGASSTEVGGISGRSRHGSSLSPPRVKQPTKSKEEFRAETEARIAAYKERLTKLKEVLSQLVEAAKKRSQDNAGSTESRAKEQTKDKASGDPKSSQTSSKSTTKEKQASKKYYEKNKEQISLKKQEANLKKEIKQVEEKIIKAREDLKKSLVDAFDKSNTNTSSNPSKDKSTKQRRQTVVSN